MKYEGSIFFILIMFRLGGLKWRHNLFRIGLKGSPIPTLIPEGLLHRKNHPGGEFLHVKLNSTINALLGVPNNLE
jgi:hypothetical protein